MHAILGTKQRQTQKFRIDGKRIPVTTVHVTENPVVMQKTMDKNGYNAIQIGFGTTKKTNKPMQGHLKGANVEKAPQFLREVRFADGEGMPQVGEKIALAAVLAAGDIIDVTGTSKGKGFAGGVKRFHFKGGPRTHGQSDRERAPGSIGQTTTPGRVYKGKRMAGKMGFETVTIKNLTVAHIDGDVLYIQGLIPGMPGALIKITKRGTNKKFVPLLVEEKKAKAVEEVSAEEPVIVEEQAAEVVAESVIKEASAEEKAKVKEEAKA